MCCMMNGVHGRDENYGKNMNISIIERKKRGNIIKLICYLYPPQIGNENFDKIMIVKNTRVVGTIVRLFSNIYCNTRYYL